MLPVPFAGKAARRIEFPTDEREENSPPNCVHLLRLYIQLATMEPQLQWAQFHQLN